MEDLIASLIGGLLGGIFGKRRERKRAGRRVAAFRAGQELRIPAALRADDGPKRPWLHGELWLGMEQGVWRPSGASTMAVTISPAEAIVEYMREPSEKELWSLNPRSTIITIHTNRRQLELGIPNLYVDCFTEVFGSSSSATKSP